MKTISLIDEIQTDAIEFGNEANLSRAMPYIRDGLKPSQRAVVFGAYDQGYASTRPHIKSLKLDGFLAGELWPHGSSYQTIARLTQPFVLNIPLLDMHGSNGSQLGTPDPAASRYTEVRLSKAAEDGLLANLNKDVCEWIPNYSEDRVWPKLLNALMPVLYTEGSEGLGFCYSQYWAPGNLTEFFDKVKIYFESGKITCDNLYPDFPTKGIICNKSEMRQIYETGKGSIILRGVANVDDNVITITELPYQIYVTYFMEQLKSLIVPDKKGIVKIEGVNNIYNMSGESGMHIELECTDNNTAKIVLNKLYKYSDLQVNIAVNQYGIIDGLPELVNFEKYLKVYVDHNLTCLQREYKYDLDKANSRLEVVNGLISAISQIDSIIAIIKNSKSSEAAKQALISNFKFTSVQAQAIVDMKLGKLANLEHDELIKEQNELNKTLDKCNKFLASEKLQKKEFLNRLSDFVEKYGWERRTKVCDIDLEAEKNSVKEVKIEENYNIILTKTNEIKKTSGKVKMTDDIISCIEVNNKDRFILISETGKMYKLDCKNINLVSQGSSGQKLDKLLNDKIINIFTGNETDEYLFMISDKGLAKKIKSSIVFGLSKCIGAPIYKIDNEKLIYCKLVNDDSEIPYTLGDKPKKLLVKDFNDKGRTAGGVVAIKLGKKLNTFKL